MRIPLSVRLVCAAGFVAMVGALFVGGAQPEAAGLFEAPWDKVAHFVYFAALATLLMVATQFRHPLAAIAVMVLVGATDELAQTQLPGRHADIPDLLTDVAAAAFTVLVLMWIWRRLARRAA